MKNPYQASDEVWKMIKPYIPKHERKDPSKGGRPRVDDRKVFDAILFVAKTGICSSSTAHLRFQEWTKAGFFRKLWEIGLLKYDEKIGIGWKWQSMDGAMTKSPLGGEKNRAQSNRSR